MGKVFEQRQLGADSGKDGHRHDHSHDHGHDHSHDHVFHSHTPIEKMRRALFLTVIVLVVEAVGGVLSHSLALLSDAGHVVTDIGAIGISWYALRQAQKPPDATMTYGYHRTGIIAALINAVALIVISLLIGWAAYGRLLHPPHVNSLWMFGSAGVGLAINLYLGLGMRHETDINVRSATLHMLGDAGASAGVIVAAAIIAWTKWDLIDPLLSFLIALLIIYGAWGIVRQTVSILLESAPRNIRIDEVADSIRAVAGVRDVHDLHVWSITSGRNALSCHVVLDGERTIGDTQTVLRSIEQELLHFGIGHATIQTEDSGHPHKESVLCDDCPR